MPKKRITHGNSAKTAKCAACGLEVATEKRNWVQGRVLSLHKGADGTVCRGSLTGRFGGAQ